MRWKIKNPEPKIGDIRHLKEFALLPTIVGQYIVWLEHWQVTEEYMMVLDAAGAPRPEWEEISRRTLDYGF